MKNFSRNSALLAAAIAGLLCTTASNAAVDLDTGATATVYAKELNIETSGTIQPPVATFKSGFGFASGSQFFIRLDLDNGAKFATAVTSGLLAASATTVVAAADITIASGGAQNDTYVVFSLKATASVATTEVFTYTPTASNGTITVANRNPVTLRYRAFPDATSAVGATASTTGLKDKSAVYFKFDSAVALSPGTSGAPVANVTDNFLKFIPVSASSTSTIATIGQFKLGNTTSAVIADGSTSANTNTLTNLASGSSSLTINGDFSAAFDSGSTSSSSTALARVWLQTGSDCTSGTPTALATNAGNLVPTAIASDGKSVTFANLTSGNGFGTTASAANTAAAFAAGLTLCYKPNGTTPIATSDYTATFKPVAQSGYVVSAITGSTFGAVKRNGAELQAPFANVVSGYKSRIYLTNTGTQDAPFTMVVQSEPGTSFTPAAALPAGFTLSNGLIAGTIPKGGNVFMALDALGTFTAASGSTGTASTRGSLIFKIAADCNNIQGMFQLRNLTTGDFDSAPLLRPAGDCH
jgi:hypothetical protein